MKEAQFGFMYMPVLSGNSGRDLAISLSEILGMNSIAIESRKFPDGEGYVRVPSESFDEIRSEPVILVSNTFPDSGIMRTILMLEAINDIRRGDLENFKGEGEQKLEYVGPGVFLAVPYYGYARQDKRFSPGETISARVISEILGKVCDGMVILDLHEPKVLEDCDFPVKFFSSMPEIAERLKEDVDPDFILSPDKGAIDRASEVASIGGWEFSYLEKTRIDAHTIEHQAKDLDVNGKVVAIVDDMISTGGTICRASDALRRQGAKSVYAACTHGLFTGGALSKLASHVDGVYTTDSLRNPRSVVSSAPALARGLRELME